MTRVFIAALATSFACGAFAGSAKNGSWATVAGYHPGMPKDAARKVGLADCDALLRTVECKASQPLKLGDATSTSSRIELDEKTGRVEKVEFQFPGAAYQAVAAAMVAQLGEPTAKDGDFKADYWRRVGHGSCMPVLVWHRGGDEVLAVCGASGRRSGLTYVVADRVPGRGKEWAEITAARAKSNRTADSFNSK